MSKNVHITADVPEHLLAEVDKRVEDLDVSRSHAIRKGLALFLLSTRQELTELVNSSDNVAEKTPEPVHVG